MKRFRLGTSTGDEDRSSAVQILLGNEKCCSRGALSLAIAYAQA
jgi:hypothetical protein